MKSGRLNLDLLTKLILSGLSIVFLACVLIFPNGSSYFGRHYTKYLLPIANQLGLNTTWNFFSPDPANTMYFAYSIHFEDDMGNEVEPSIEGFIPPEKNQIVTDTSKRRMLYAMRFLILDESKFRQLFIPWLCQKYPRATRVLMKSVVEKIPLLEQATIAYKDHALSDFKETVESYNQSYSCKEDFVQPHPVDEGKNE